MLNAPGFICETPNHMSPGVMRQGVRQRQYERRYYLMYRSNGDTNGSDSSPLQTTP